MALNHNILLESGTNEFEIVEFTLKGEIAYHFCINVAKVREVITFPEIIHVPESHLAIVGTANLRKKLVPIIDLAYWLGIRDKTLSEKSKVIITYFNSSLNGFVVDDVVGIHRITWSEIKDYAAISDFKLVDAVLGVVKLKGNLVQLLDFERIIADINPITMTSKNANIDMALKSKRLGKQVYLAEDSPVVRKVLVNNFERAGYDIKAFDNGASLLMEFDKKVPDVVVTDLEMPGTSGDYVVKKIREFREYDSLPIIVFSSMASEENEKKLKSIGASMLIGKPELDFLIHKVDEVALFQLNIKGEY